MDILLGFCIGVIASTCAFFLYLRKKEQSYVMIQQERDSLESELSVERKLYEERKAFYDNIEGHLSHSFKSISSDVLGESNKSFMQLAEAVLSKYEEKAVQRFDGKEEAINRLVNPISQSLTNFNDHIQAIEKQRLVAYQSVKEQIDSLKSAHHSLLTETNRLSGALKASSSRGRWGELQLRRIVELAGMVEHCDFAEQPSLSSEGVKLRPDMIIQLPGNRSIVVDAKVPLQAYLEALEEENGDKRRELMEKHGQQLKRQITELSKKSYWAALEESPEFVILFLPGESFFSAALEVDPTLIEAGAEQKVIIATPTTLIALLRTVALAWRQETLAANSKYIAKLGKELHQRICDFSFHMADVGKNLKSSVNSSNKAVGTMESRLLVTARKFKSLGVEGGKKDAPPLPSIDLDTRSMSELDF